MPGKQRLRANEERGPAPSRQHTREPSQHDPIRRPQLGPRYLPAKNSQLMTQDKDLNLLRIVAGAHQYDEPKDPPQRPVDERDDREPDMLKLPHATAHRHARQHA